MPATGSADDAAEVWPAGAVLSGHVDRLKLFAQVLDAVQDQPGLPFPAVRGSWQGEPVVVVGTGMGGPVTARAAASLVARGSRVLVRAGGAGPVCDGVEPGDMVVASAAVRHEGTSKAFLSPNEPAVADPIVVRELLRAVESLPARAHVGVVHSKDSFYGEVDPGASPQRDRLAELWRAWRELGVLASEMEAAALFGIASYLRVRAGAVLRINDVHRDSGAAGDSQLGLCHAAVRAVVHTVHATGSD